jgi:hypothetical protein
MVASEGSADVSTFEVFLQSLAGVATAGLALWFGLSAWRSRGESGGARVVVRQPGPAPRPAAVDHVNAPAKRTVPVEQAKRAVPVEHAVPMDRSAPVEWPTAVEPAAPPPEATDSQRSRMRNAGGGGHLARSPQPGRARFVAVGSGRMDQTGTA